jgi:beta-glucosidase-like glycosyl hydrolase
VQDLTLLYLLGQEIGRQCQLVGAHLNLAPVIDVNCNPQNPIIHMRSFGENPIEVAKRGQQVMRGIQSMNVISCAKHFPGHGDTSIDSHVDLPIIPHDKMRLQNVELYPFQKLVDAGVQAIETAHLYVESLAEATLLPATFSSLIVTCLLQKKMGFDGLIISDALNMRALTKRYSPGEIAVKTILAGHDLLLYGDHIAPNIDQILRIEIPQALSALKTAVENKEIPEELIDAKVRKILKAKKRCGLFDKPIPNPIENIRETINSAEALALKKILFEEAITVLRNEDVLPIKKQKIALVEWGQSPVFNSLIKAASNADVLSWKDPELFTKLSAYSCLILSVSHYFIPSTEFSVGQKEKSILNALSQCGIPGIVVVFDSPYSLLQLPLFSGVIVAYENEAEAQEAAAKVVLGQLSPKGRLPVGTQPHFREGAGISWGVLPAQL